MEKLTTKALTTLRITKKLSFKYIFNRKAVVQMTKTVYCQMPSPSRPLKGMPKPKYIQPHHFQPILK